MIGKAALFTLLIGSASAEGGWFSHMKEKAFSKARSAILADSDLIKANSLMQEAKFVAQSCSAEGHAMQVQETAFDFETLALKVKGDLKRDVLGGRVNMKLKLGKAPPGLSSSQKFKRHLAWSVGAKKSASEDLCAHLKRTRGLACPLRAGVQDMAFGLHRLPSAISAGKFHLELNAVDAAGEHVVCVKGELDVPRGPNGELFRRLQEMVSSASRSSGFMLLIVAFLMVEKLM